MKQCPYCGEDIPVNSERCPLCGEIIVKNKNYLKIMLFLILALFVTLTILYMFNADKYNNDSKYERMSIYEIQSFGDEYTPYRKPYVREVCTDSAPVAKFIKFLLNEEHNIKKDLSNIFLSKENKTKVFNNFLSQIKRIEDEDWRTERITGTLPQNYMFSGLELKLNYTKNNLPYYVFSNPKCNFIELRYGSKYDDNSYLFYISINYKYLMKEYGKYLTSGYKEYMKCMVKIDDKLNHTSLISDTNNLSLLDRAKLSIMLENSQNKYPLYARLYPYNFSYPILQTMVCSYNENKDDIIQAGEYLTKNAIKTSENEDIRKICEIYAILKQNNYEFDDRILEKY